MEIVVKGADFSQLGLGNTRWIENYILNAGITNGTQKTALRALYNSVLNAGLDKKLQVLRLFFNTTLAGDRLNLLNPTLSDGAFYLDFAGDTAANHTLQGWTPPALPNIAFSNYKITSAAQLTNFHMHAWNTTSETTTGDAGLLGASGNGSGNSLMLGLYRKRTTRTAGVIEPYTNNLSTVSSLNDTTRTGLLSLAKNAVDYKLYDNAAIVSTASQTPAITVATPMAIQEGSMIQGASTAKIFCIGYGSSIWTDADETNLYSIISTFKAAIGA